MPAPAIVPDLEIVEERVGELEAGAPALPVQELDLHADQNASIMGLSESPTDPMDGTRPEALLGVSASFGGQRRELIVRLANRRTGDQPFEEVPGPGRQARQPACRWHRLSATPRA